MINIDSFNVLASVDHLDTMCTRKKIIELTKQIRDQTVFYKSECEKMEFQFSRLHLLGGVSYRNELEVLRDKTLDVHQKVDAVEQAANSVVLSALDIDRKRSNYVAKLKICIKIYLEFNLNLSKKLKTLKSEYELSQTIPDKILTATTEELKVMEEKIRRYENELVKLERKHPWLKDSTFVMNNISKEIALLKKLQSDKEKLEEELKHFHGLKPNIAEASIQLQEIKAEFEDISEKLIGKLH